MQIYLYIKNYSTGIRFPLFIENKLNIVFPMMEELTYSCEMKECGEYEIIIASNIIR